MTDHDFKVGVLKALKDISKELHEMNQRYSKVEEKPPLQFICPECKHHFTTADRYLDEEGAFCVCPKCYSIVYSQEKHSL